jgi:DNA-binding Lrp family transcriptional regulator
MSIALDRIDKHILKLMQTNARISNLELADQVESVTWNWPTRWDCLPRPVHAG